MTRPLHLLPLLLAVAGCQSTPAPTSAPPARPAPRAAMPAPPKPPEVSGGWSFSIDGERCNARVGHREATLAITAGPEPRLAFSLSAPGTGLPASNPVRIAFKGEGSGWQLAARTDPRRLAYAAIPLDGTGEGRVRDLLGGGTVTASGRGVSVPALVVPDAGVSGRDWYACLARLAGD
ncbi:hypothetical protein ACFQX4_06680 [Roseomonas sp. GCM10028921]